jgi:hypothetical protein
VASLDLVGVFLAHLGVLAGVLLAPMAVARACGLRNQLAVLMAGMAGVGILSFLTFGAYLVDDTFGRDLGIGIVAGSAVLLVALLRTRDARRGLWQTAARPFALLAAATLLMLSLGYLYGATGGAAEVPENRYSLALPTDNELPWIFAQQLEGPARPLPKFLFGQDGWRGSDRPPMETAYYLVDVSVIPSPDFLDFEVVGALLQSFWIIGLWGLLRAVRAPGRLIAACLAVALFSTFTVVNTFFVWPKLLPAAPLLLVLGAVLSPSFELFNRRRVPALLLGASLGCAMLGHQGSSFVVIAFFLTLLLIRRIPSRRLLGYSSLASFLVYTPWLLYQRYYDPPGDKLERLQLGAIPNDDPTKTLSQALQQAYRTAGWHTVWHNKVDNLTKPWTDTFGTRRYVETLLTSRPGSAANTAAATALRTDHFYFLIPSLGLMALGPLALIVARLLRRKRWRTEGIGSLGRFTAIAYLCLALNYLLWAAILFGPGETIIHQGSYFVPLLGFAAGCISWWLLSPRLCYLLVAAQSAFGLYLAVLVPVPNPGMTEFAASPAAVPIVLACGALGLSLAALGWVARRSPGDSGEAEQAEARGRQVPDVATSRPRRRHAATAG